MELDTQSERDELSRRGAHALPSPANSLRSRQSRESRSRSRRAVQFPIEKVLDRIVSRESVASSESSMSMQSQAQSPGNSSSIRSIASTLWFSLIKQKLRTKIEQSQNY